MAELAGLGGGHRKTARDTGGHQGTPGDTEAGSQHSAGHLGKLRLRDVLRHLSRQLEVLEHLQESLK